MRIIRARGNDGGLTLNRRSVEPFEIRRDGGLKLFGVFVWLWMSNNLSSVVRNREDITFNRLIVSGSNDLAPSTDLGISGKENPFLATMEKQDAACVIGTVRFLRFNVAEGVGKQDLKSHIALERNALALLQENLRWQQLRASAHSRVT